MPASADFVTELVGLIEALGCDVWLDGGWAVDALLGEETRPHDDVDIVVQERDLASIGAALAARGFAPVQRDDTRAWNFVLADADDRQVDVHVVVFDGDGNGIYGPPEDGARYPAEAFTGHGVVAGTPVKCMSLAFQLGNRTGFALREKDHHDLRLLHEKRAAGPD